VTTACTAIYLSFEITGIRLKLELKSCKPGTEEGIAGGWDGIGMPEAVSGGQTGGTVPGKTEKTLILHMNYV